VNSDFQQSPRSRQNLRVRSGPRKPSDLRPGDGNGSFFPARRGSPRPSRKGRPFSPKNEKGNRLLCSSAQDVNLLLDGEVQSDRGKGTRPIAGSGKGEIFGEDASHQRDAPAARPPCEKYRAGHRARTTASFRAPCGKKPEFALHADSVMNSPHAAMRSANTIRAAPPRRAR